MSTKSLIRRGDLVQLVSGSGAGRAKEAEGSGRPQGVRGKVRLVDRRSGTAVVDGVRVVRKAMKPNPKKGHRGGIVNKESPVPLSNLMLVCQSCDRPVRVRRERSDGKLKRLCARCGEEI